MKLEDWTLRNVKEVCEEMACECSGCPLKPLCKVAPINWELEREVQL